MPKLRRRSTLGSTKDLANQEPEKPEKEDTETETEKSEKPDKPDKTEKTEKIEINDFVFRIIPTMKSEKMGTFLKICAGPDK